MPLQRSSQASEDLWSLSDFKYLILFLLSCLLHSPPPFLPSPYSCYAPNAQDKRSSLGGGHRKASQGPGAGGAMRLHGDPPTDAWD